MVSIDGRHARTVLLAGATGMLGSRVADRLLRQPQAAVRALVRPGGPVDAAQRELLRELRQRGAVLVEGDLLDDAALEKAAEGVEVVVSTLQGGYDVLVAGQVALARAAARSGARRFLPADFTCDLFKATPGEHAGCDLRREADERIAGTGLQHVHVLTGAFTDALLGPSSVVLDHARATATYWGTGEEVFDATSVDDTAEVAARVALDPGVGSGKFAVAGEQLTLGRLVDAAEAATGSTYRRHSLGSVEELRIGITRSLQAGASPAELADDVDALHLLTGQTALEHLQNQRYPDIAWRSCADVARQVLAGTTT